MQTVKKTVEVPRLKIQHDDDTESPRSWSNIGYFVTCDGRHYSPDRNATIEAIMRDTGEEATSQVEHMKLIGKEIKAQLGEKVLAIYPVVKHEHGSIAYSLGTTHGFDYSNNGFYIVTDKTAEEYGHVASPKKKKEFESVIKSEIETYNTWVNGYCYRFELYDSKGNIEDSCGGFFDIEDIREYLPDTFRKEKLEDYINDEF